MKKLIATLCAALACSFLFTATPVLAKSGSNYVMTTTKDYRIAWSNGTNKIYFNKNQDKLYMKNMKTGKVKLLKTFKLDKDGDWSYYIGNVYGTTVYLNKISGIGEANLYTYNWKTDKFERFRKNFTILNANGKYLLTANYLPTDISPYPAYIYKITSKGIEKVKKLGQDTTQAQFVGKKIYYSKYPTDASIREMSVYCCDINGKNQKLLFKAKATDEYGYVMLQKVSTKSIEYVEVPNEGDSVYYRYDMKTEKITEISEAEAIK